MGIKDKMNKKALLEKIGVPRLLLMILAGIVLLVCSLPSSFFPSDKEEAGKAVTKEEETIDEDVALRAMEQYARKKEAETKKILSCVEGIGKVEVMLTLSASEEKVLLKNQSSSENAHEEKDHTGGTRKEKQYEMQTETVTVQKEGSETPYVVQVASPKIEGAVVVAKGASSAEVVREIIEAMEALFPIEAHKIKVMKME